MEWGAGELKTKTKTKTENKAAVIHWHALDQQHQHHSGAH